MEYTINFALLSLKIFFQLQCPTRPIDFATTLGIFPLTEEWNRETLVLLRARIILYNLSLGNTTHPNNQNIEDSIIRPSLEICFHFNSFSAIPSNMIPKTRNTIELIFYTINEFQSFNKEKTLQFDPLAHVKASLIKYKQNIFKIC